MLQSLYTSAVVDQIIHDRLDAAARSRSRAPFHRRIFGRGGRGAPLPAPQRRLRVTGASR